MEVNQHQLTIDWLMVASKDWNIVSIAYWKNGNQSINRFETRD